MRFGTSRSNLEAVNIGLFGTRVGDVVATASSIEHLFEETQT
jgi:hypothetical protein